jgi:predicted nucleic acid-binding protein
MTTVSSPSGFANGSCEAGTPGMFDALQIACAIEAGCDGFLTNDRDLVRAPGVKVFVLDDLEP